MKLFYRIFFASLITLFFSACGKKEETAVQDQPAKIASEQKATMPAPEKEPPKEVNLVANERPLSDTGLQSLSQSFLQSESSHSGLASNISTYSDKLKNMLPDSESDLKKTVQSTLAALVEKNDIKALQYLPKLVSSNLTEGQTTLLMDLKDTVSSLVLQRNFEISDPVVKGHVATVADGLREKDTVKVLEGLKMLGDQVKMSESQKQLVSQLVKNYTPMGVQDAAESFKNKLGF